MKNYESLQVTVESDARSSAGSPPGNRKYTVSAVEKVCSRGCLLGHVQRSFYSKEEELQIDPVDVWDDFDDDASKFLHLCEEELFTEHEADLVIGLIKRHFADLKCIAKRNGYHEGTLSTPVPLRTYPNDGGYSQWDMSEYYQELGFRIGAFADYDIWNVMVDEPLLGIALPQPNESECCALCAVPLEKSVLSKNNCP